MRLSFFCLTCILASFFSLGSQGASPCSLKGVLEQEQRTAVPRLQGVIRGVEPGELEFAGRVVREPKDFVGLEDGVYIYLIDERGEILWSRRVPDKQKSFWEPGVQFFATHRSLARTAGRSHPDPRFIAAGEVRIRNGAVSELNNKSGTFKPGQANLEYAQARLQAAGLRFEGKPRLLEELPPPPEIVEFAKQMGISVKTTDTPGFVSHAADAAHAFFELRYQHQPEYARLAALDRRLAVLFPDPEVPGAFRATEILARLQKEMRQGRRKEALIAWSVVQQIQKEGVPFAVFQLQDQPPEIRQAVLKLLEETKR